MLLVDIILPGLVLGGMYALIALGLTLQYGVARIMNLSYGESLVAAAFGAFSLYSGLGLSPLAALLLAVPVAMVLNWLLYRFLLERLMRRGKDRGAQEIDSILVTFGVLFVIQGAMLIVFGIGAGIVPACFFHLPHRLDGVTAGPKAYGVLMTGRNTGVFSGPILMAWLFQGNLGWHGAAFVVAGISLIAALLSLTLAPKLRVAGPAAAGDAAA